MIHDFDILLSIEKGHQLTRLQHAFEHLLMKGPYKGSLSCLSWFEWLKVTYYTWRIQRWNSAHAMSIYCSSRSWEQILYWHTNRNWILLAALWRWGILNVTEERYPERPECTCSICQYSAEDSFGN